MPVGVRNEAYAARPLIIHMLEGGTNIPPLRGSSPSLGMISRRFCNDVAGHMSRQYMYDDVRHYFGPPISSLPHHVAVYPPKLTL